MKKGRNKAEEVSMLQTHGELQVNNPESQEISAGIDKPKYKKLSQILRAHDEDFTDYGFYNTDDISKYEKSIREMSRSSLEQHCRAVGFIPTGETHLILKQLVKAFKQHFQSSMKLPQPKTFSKETEKKIESLLRGQSEVSKISDDSDSE